MKILFDTSVLIPAFVKTHSQHKQALPWLKKAIHKEIKMFVASHTLLECYAVLTSLPLSPKINPGMAKQMMSTNIEKNAKIITLSAKDTQQCLDLVTSLGLTGGVTYDAIIFQAAKIAKVNSILTFNTKDFKRLTPENPGFIISP